MTTRTKRPAKAVPVPKSKDECAAAIQKLGGLQRMHLRQRADLDDLVAAATANHAPILQSLSDQIEGLTVGIQTWCEAHRDELCGATSKTANLVTGEVSWRKRPPSVTVRSVELATATLKRLGLGRFLRTTEEVNKAAILAEPEALQGVKGITVVTGVEDFVITPFEVNA